MQDGIQIYKNFLIQWHSYTTNFGTSFVSKLKLWWNGNLVFEDVCDVSELVPHISIFMKHVDILESMLVPVGDRVVSASCYQGVDISEYGYEDDNGLIICDNETSQPFIINSPKFGIVERREYVKDLVYSVSRKSTTLEGEVVEYSIN